MTTTHERIRQYDAEHPGASLRDVARSLGVHYSTVSRARTATPATPAVQHVADQDGHFQDDRATRKPGLYMRTEDGYWEQIDVEPGEEKRVEVGGHTYYVERKPVRKRSTQVRAV